MVISIKDKTLKEIKPFASKRHLEIENLHIFGQIKNQLFF